MNNPESVKIVKRFFEALDMIISTNVIRGIQTFTTAYDINKRNFYTARKEPERDMFQIAWLAHLINDFGVSAQWIMTGVGGMFGRREYPFRIDESRLKVKMDIIESFIGKRAVVSYIPTQRNRILIGEVKAIKYDKGPAIEVESDDNAIYMISLYTITDISESE